MVYLLVFLIFIVSWSYILDIKFPEALIQTLLAAAWGVGFIAVIVSVVMAVMR